MNKYGHLTVTMRLTENLKKRHRLALVFGSILPDILVHTYIKGHTWSSSYSKVSKRLHRLEKHGRMNCISFLSLGYAIHYIQDYFTYPHNAWYTEPMSEHVLYEIKFTSYIRDTKELVNKTASGSETHTICADMMLEYLISNHIKYSEYEQGFENDYLYITTASNTIINNYIQLFNNISLPTSDCTKCIADIPYI